MSNLKPRYAVYRTNKNDLNTPYLNSDGDAYHVRLIARSNLSNEEIARDLALEEGIKEEQTHSFLSVLANYIERKNSEGHIVKIDGLGSFAPAITSTLPVIDPDKVKNSQIVLRDLNFTTDRNLLKRLQSVRLVRDWEHGNCTMNSATRGERIMAYLDMVMEQSGPDSEGWITRKSVMELNKCSQSTAIADLDKLIAQGLVKMVKIGNGVYYRKREA